MTKHEMRKNTKTKQLVLELRSHFEGRVEYLTQREYLEVLQSFISILQSFEDCVKDELKEQGEEI